EQQSADCVAVSNVAADVDLAEVRHCPEPFAVDSCFLQRNTANAWQGARTSHPFLLSRCARKRFESGTLPTALRKNANLQRHAAHARRANSARLARAEALG